MKRFFVSSLFAMLAVATAANAQAQEKVWAFGDSLSDNGNLSLLFATDGNDDTFLPPEAYKPYFPAALGGQFPLQRISTGKTVTEYVAEYFGTTLLPSGLEGQIGPVAANNFAIFGARASLTSQLDLPYQVAQFAGRVAGGVDVSDDRAIVFIGANDVFAAWLTAAQPIAAGGEADIAAGEALLDEALASVRSYLLGAGGQIQLPDGSLAPVPSLKDLRLSKFVVLNVPGIDGTPWVNQTGVAFGNQEEVVKVAKKMTKYYNRGLKKIVKDMKKADLDVIAIDTYKLNKKIRKKADDLGFANQDDDCFLTNTLATLTEGLRPTPGVFRDTCSAATTEEFMFIDTAHPTGAVHSLIAEEVLEDLPCL